MVYESVADLDFRIGELPRIKPPQRVLFTTPDYFDVQYVINPHMAGNEGSIDREAAYRQWDHIQKVYRSLELAVDVLEGRPGLPDMVFCANQTLPCRRPDGTLAIVPSRMHAAQRAREVGHYQRFFESRGYRTVPLPEHVPDFEGMGDALWHTGRYLLWGGFGFRSSLDAYLHLADVLDLGIIALRLEDPDFYHLDTCLSVVNETTAIVFPGAFSDSGLELIHALFPTVIEAPETEARSLFACNAHSPDGQNVVIQTGCDRTVRLLEEAGLTPVEVDTGEFLKAGGSVFCMKQMFW